MAISRKPLKKTKDNDEMTFENPMVQTFEDVDHEDDDKVDEDDDKYAKLEKLYSELKADRERDVELDYLRQPTNQSQVTQAPVVVDPNSVPLPDAALEAEAFAAAVAKRAEIAAQNTRNKSDFDKKQKDELDNKIASLWDDFGEGYPDIVGKEEKNKKRIEYVANELATEAAAKGLDVQRYMFVTRNRFMKDLAARYEETFGAVEPSIEDDDDPPVSRNSRRSARSRDRDEEDNGRAASIISGSNGGSRRQKKGEEEDAGLGMIEDLHVIQKKLGFY